MSYKRYYLPGVDEIHQLVETPASKEKTDRIRFIVTVVVSVVATIASIVAAVFGALAYFWLRQLQCHNPRRSLPQLLFPRQYAGCVSVTVSIR